MSNFPKSLQILVVKSYKLKLNIREYLDQIHCKFSF